LLDPNLFAPDVGWRLAFGLGGALGIGLLFLRRNLPESPRWLFIHGREDEAKKLVHGIEREVRKSVDEDFDEPGDSITVRQRHSIGFGLIAQGVFKS
jgi:MFS family permease